VEVFGGPAVGGAFHGGYADGCSGGEEGAFDSVSVSVVGSVVVVLDGPCVICDGDCG